MVSAHHAARGKRRLPHEGPDLVSILLHAMPGALCVSRDVLAAGPAERRLGLSDLADGARSWGHLRPGRAGRTRRDSVVFSPPLSAGMLRVFRVPGADGAHVVDSADSGSHRRAAAVLC